MNAGDSLRHSASDDIITRQEQAEVIRRLVREREGIRAEAQEKIVALEAQLAGAVEDADRFRLALVRVCEANDFEGAYAAAIDALRQPERTVQS